MNHTSLKTLLLVGAVGCFSSTAALAVLPPMKILVDCPALEYTVKSCILEESKDKCKLSPVQGQNNRNVSWTKASEETVSPTRRGFGDPTIEHKGTTPNIEGDDFVCAYTFDAFFPLDPAGGVKFYPTLKAKIPSEYKNCKPDLTRDGYFECD